MQPKTWNILIALFLTAQFGTTLFNNKSLWPLCPYNMFNKTQSEIQSRIEVELLYVDGQSQFASLSHLYPVEYFKSYSITMNALELEESARREFFRLVLRRLNHWPHSGFDEVYPSPKRGIVGLRLCRRTCNIWTGYRGEYSTIGEWVFRPSEVE